MLRNNAMRYSTTVKLGNSIMMPKWMGVLIASRCDSFHRLATRLIFVFFGDGVVCATASGI